MTEFNFPDRLKAERKRLGLKSFEFAAAVGTTPSMQSNYERGHSEPGIGYLERCCAAGCDPCFLLTGVPTPGGPPHLSEEARAPMTAFHGLSPKVQAALVGLVDMVKGGHD